MTGLGWVNRWVPPRLRVSYITTPPFLRPPVTTLGESQERVRTSELHSYISLNFQDPPRLLRNRIPFSVPKAMVSGVESRFWGKEAEHHIVVALFGLKLTLWGPSRGWVTWTWYGESRVVMWISGGCVEPIEVVIRVRWDVKVVDEISEWNDIIDMRLLREYSGLLGEESSEGRTETRDSMSDVAKGSCIPRMIPWVALS